MLGGGLILGLLLTIVAAIHWIDEARIAGFVLDRASAVTGLDWRIEGEPELRWRPQPWLALPRLQIRDEAGRTLLRAQRVEVSLPWATLRGESLHIKALRIDAPEVDFDAVLAWWKQQPDTGELRLPTIDGLIIEHGRLRAGAVTLDDLHFALPRFAIGEAFSIQASGRVVTLSPTQAEPFHLSLAVQATAQPDPLRLQDLQLKLSGTGPVPVLSANGHLQLRPWSLELDGELAAWPQAWPALPSPLADRTEPLGFRLSQSGESARMAQTQVQLHRDDVQLDVHGVPDALIAWLDDPAAPELPPLLGTATLPIVELDGVRLENVHVEIEDIDPANEQSAANGRE